MTYITCPKCTGKKNIRYPGLIIRVCTVCGGTGFAEQSTEIKAAIEPAISIDFASVPPINEVDKGTEETTDEKINYTIGGKPLKEASKQGRGRPKKVTKETECQKAEEDTTTE